MEDFLFILGITLQSSVAVLLASLGEIITEKSGILNLGLEGIMLFSAFIGFICAWYTQSLILGFMGAMLAGGLLACIHAFFCIHLGSDQILSGLALTILGTGLANFLGRSFIGLQTLSLASFSLKSYYLNILLRQLNVLVILAFILTYLIHFILKKTTLGLNLSSVGENPQVASSVGLNVYKYRYLATILGGMLTGLGGAYLSLAYTPGWKENMTGGQGWIAIAMVIFSCLKPIRALVGAFLFGAFMALQFYFQAIGKELIPAYILKMLPFLLPLVILILINRKNSKYSFPQGLGKPFLRT